MTEELKTDYSKLQETVEELLPKELPFTFEELVERFVNGETEGIWEFCKEMGVWLFSAVSFPLEHGVKLLLLINLNFLK